ncbi:MAG: MBL fold metallo-hydrolase [Rhizobiaceae bacterium]|nr:MBL fold metallo-hydrolase [Rhizobiaceae bacterium]
MKCLVAIFMCIFLWGVIPSTAQETSTRAPSICQAIASNKMQLAADGGWPGLLNRNELIRSIGFELRKAQAFSENEVSITYVGHSTFRIETPAGLTIATDFAGFAGRNIIPTIVTMNHAHGTHFTIAPDQRIKHVFRGWGLDGKPAKYYQLIDDTLVRNVTTDINNQWAGYEPDGNSIFIFEVAGLCIGHLGHLHQLPTDNHYAQIGRLDVLMVPVDGGYTMNVNEMSNVVKRVNASLILPMHWFGSFSLGRFIEEIKSGFAVTNNASSNMIVSLNSLPAQPTVVVMPPESSIGLFDGD